MVFGDTGSFPLSSTQNETFRKILQKLKPPKYPTYHMRKCNFVLIFTTSSSEWSWFHNLLYWWSETLMQLSPVFSTDQHCSVLLVRINSWFTDAEHKTLLKLSQSKSKSKFKVQSPKSKGLGVTLFCCATHHPHKLFSATRHPIELKISQ